MLTVAIIITTIWGASNTDEVFCRRYLQRAVTLPGMSVLPILHINENGGSGNFEDSHRLGNGRAAL